MFIKGMTAQTSIFARFDVIKKPHNRGLVCMTDALTQSCFFNAGYSRRPQKHTNIVTGLEPATLKCISIAPFNTTLPTELHDEIIVQ